MDAGEEGKGMSQGPEFVAKKRQSNCRSGLR